MKLCNRCFIVKSLNEYTEGYAFCKQCKREDWHNNKYKQINQNKKRKLRYHTDPVYKEITLLRRHMNEAWHYSYWKNNRIMKLLKVSNKDFFVNYIVSLFQEGMSLDNYGSKADNWQFDHIIPLNAAETIEDVHNLFYYKNIQPLWRHQNNFKRDKILII